MPVPEAAGLVARFLRANHYNETLEAFLREAGLPEDTGSLGPGEWTIEQIIQEKKQFDASLKYEKTGTNEAKGWNKNAPSQPQEPEMSIGSNVLCVNGGQERNVIYATCADRSWKYASSKRPFKAIADASYLNDSPVLSTKAAGDGLLVSTSMSGHVTLRDAATHGLIGECRHHTKYAVQVASAVWQDRLVVASAGWDQKVYLYSIDRSKLRRGEAADSAYVEVPDVFGSPIHAETFPTNPESLIFVNHPDNGKLYLVVSRRDSTHLYYYSIDDAAEGQLTVQATGRQNLAPHSNAWVAFTPCSLAPCPTDPTLIAVATSHLPHMKLIVVRLLFPEGSPWSPTEAATQASVARAELALQDREDTAIRLHVTTMAPQTPYSTPQVVWRPDGSGLFVNGDDGVIRGIETTTGKIVSMLKGHEAGSKVRTLWAGLLRIQGDGAAEEVLLSGGFDKKLLIWTTNDEQA